MWFEEAEMAHFIIRMSLFSISNECLENTEKIEKRHLGR